MKIKLYTDGASRGNPGEAGIGVVAFSDCDEELVSYFEYIGRASNNVAEYKALLAGLKLIKKYIPCSVEVFMDSELVVRQMQGLYKVKAEGLLEYHQNAKSILNVFESVRFIHIPRTKNKTADALANRAIEEKINIK